MICHLNPHHNPVKKAIAFIIHSSESYPQHSIKTALTRVINDLHIAKFNNQFQFSSCHINRIWYRWSLLLVKLVPLGFQDSTISSCVFYLICFWISVSFVNSKFSKLCRTLSHYLHYFSSLPMLRPWGISPSLKALNSIYMLMTTKVITPAQISTSKSMLVLLTTSSVFPHKYLIHVTT